MDRQRVRQAALALAVGIATVWPCAAGGGTLGTEFVYQGRLQDAGTPVNGTVDLRFALWDAATGGTQIGMTQDVTDHPVAKGLFTVPIDFEAKAFRGDARWLEIAVDGTTLTPRQPLTATPYAIYALQAPWSGLRDVPGDIADGDDDTIYFAGDGLSLVGDTFHVAFAGSGAAATASRSDHDHFGESWSGAATSGLEVTNSASDAAALAGYATGTGGTRYGVYGEASYAAGMGVKGRGYHLGVVGDTTATTGEPVGVMGISDAGKGTGVYGSASATGGNNRGVEGRSYSDEGIGVYGTAPRRGVQGDASRTTGDAYGVYGTADSTSGHGVYGEATATSGTTYGVHGQTSSPNGWGGYFGGGKGLFASGLAVGTTSPTHIVDVDGGAYCNGTQWKDASSRALKRDIRDLTAAEAADALVKRRPTKYRYKAAPDDEVVGFIAEDVPALVAGRNRDGLSALEIAAVLTRVVQQQQQQITQLRAEIDAIRRSTASAQPTREEETR